jgi:methyl-accepting chemotaxis protein
VNIQQKIFPPVFLAIIIFGFLGYGLMKRELVALEEQLYRDLVISKQNEINSLIENTSENALRQASLFTQDTRVIDAFELAYQGNINNESDPNVQQARELLRLELAEIITGYQNIMESKFKLHFHLANGRSLVRMWQDKQTKKNGVWVDISDDLTSFRQTVLDVNNSGKSIQGVELGRGGFEIRGIAPIKSREGKQLGSVEVLEEFKFILEQSVNRQNVTGKSGLFLLMNSDRLAITTSLQDPEKYPVLDERYVLVYSTEGSYGQELITSNFLDRGRENLAFQEFPLMVLSVFPVNDYQGKQIGLIVYSFDINFQRKLINQVLITMVGTLIMILIILGIIIYYTTSKSLIKPLQKIIDFINQVKAGQKDITLSIHSNDEIETLGNALNQLILSQAKVLEEIKIATDQVLVCTNELSFIFREQEIAIDNQVISTEKVVDFVEDITEVSNNLVTTMEQVDLMLQETVSLANHSQTELIPLIEAIKEMSKGSHSISNKLNIINNNAMNITSVVTTISKVAQQTNLLSLNASIEAEKAGEYGRGFAVVAREMRRLADQTAVGVLEIETIVEGMETAVNAGVMEMDRFVSEVQNNLNEINRISVALNRIITQVQLLSPSFTQVNLAIDNQSQNAQKINQLILDLNQKMLLIRTSVYQSNQTINILNESTKKLKEQETKSSLS